MGGTPADINEQINHWLWRRVSLSIGTLLGEHGRASLTGDSEEKMNYQGWAEGSGNRCCSLSLRWGPVREPREAVHLQGTAGDSGRRAPEMEHLCLWELC